MVIDKLPVKYTIH